MSNCDSILKAELNVEVDIQPFEFADGWIFRAPQFLVSVHSETEQGGKEKIQRAMSSFVGSLNRKDKGELFRFLLARRVPFSLNVTSNYKDDVPSVDDVSSVDDAPYVDDVPSVDDASYVDDVPSVDDASSEREVSDIHSYVFRLVQDMEYELVL